MRAYDIIIITYHVLGKELHMYSTQESSVTYHNGHGVGVYGSAMYVKAKLY